MRFLSLFLATVTLMLPAAAVPFSSSGFETRNELLGNYIVTLKDDASKSDVLDSLGANSVQSAGNDWKVINAFAGKFDETTVKSLRDSASVEHVEENIALHSLVTQTYAPWGLQRISSDTSLASYNASALAYNFTYEEPSEWGVDIYIVDSGINTNHSQFCGGRAKWGQTFVQGAPDKDDDGHGTHVAGIAAGIQFGVAKHANLIAVKVLNSTGEGLLLDVLSGLDYVYQQVQLTKRPSVVNLSFGGNGSFVLDSVVNALTKSGIHVVVAAGNDSLDVKDFSPARAEGVISVGATNITNQRAYYSDFGQNVTIFAPGSDIISAWGTDEFAINVESGTSMAAPHVSGLVAYLLAFEGNRTPEEMKRRLQELAIKGALKDIPEGTNNLLAQIPKRTGH